MVKSNTWMLKAPIQLKERLDKVRIERIKNGKDKQMTTYNRLCLAMSRHEALLNDLATADFIKDKRGQLGGQEAGGSVFSIFQFMIVAFLAIVMFAGMIYVQGELNILFHDVGVMNDQNNPGKNSTDGSGYVNMTLAADQTFGEVNKSIQALRMVALVYILALAISIIITNLLIRLHPIWFFAYMLISLLAIVFSVPISNSYEVLKNTNVFVGSDGSGGLASFVGANFFMEYLPILVLVISILGGVFLFINLIRSGQEGEFR